MNKHSNQRPDTFYRNQTEGCLMTALSGGWNDLIRAKHTVCYRHLAYFHSTLRNKPPPLALRTILLVQSQRPQETCQRRRLHWLKPRSQTDPGSTDANVGGTFFFSCLFFLKLQLVLLEKFVKLHQWRSETLVWKGAPGERTPPGFQIPWNQWSEWHWCFYSR